MTKTELLVAIEKVEKDIFLVTGLSYGSRSRARPAALDKLIEKHTKLVAEYEATYGTLPSDF